MAKHTQGLRDRLTASRRARNAVLRQGRVGGRTPLDALGEQFKGSMGNRMIRDNLAGKGLKAIRKAGRGLSTAVRKKLTRKRILGLGGSRRKRSASRERDTSRTR